MFSNSKCSILHLKLFFSARSLLALSMSSGKPTTEFDASPKQWESEDSVSNSLDVFWLLRGLQGFLYSFFSSSLNSNTGSKLSGKYAFLPIPKDTQICFWLKWNSQTMTFFVLLNLSVPPVRPSFSNLQPFHMQCWIFWQFKKYNTNFYSACIIKGTLTSWNATTIAKTTSIIFLRTFLAWILIYIFISHFHYNNFLGHTKLCYNRMM